MTLSPEPDTALVFRQLFRSLRDPKVKKQTDLTQAQWDAARGHTIPRPAVIDLLTRHSDPSYTPSLAAGARAARTAYLNGLSVPELLEELDCHWSRWRHARTAEFDALAVVMNPSFG